MRYLVYSLLIIFASCTDVNKETIETGPCGTAIKEINYPSDVKPIIREHCISCHKDYIFYDSLNAQINSGAFYKRVILKRDMPSSGGLDTCDYIILKRWIYNGHSNK
jgi:hypothetical protein